MRGGTVFQLQKKVLIIFMAVINLERWYKLIDTKQIEEIEKLIFDFQIPAAMGRFASLTEALILASESLDQAKLGEMLLIIKGMDSALSTKDYLLFNDLLEYELKPFVEAKLS